MGKLWHVGNTFHTEPQVEFAERLNRHAFQRAGVFLPQRIGSQRGRVQTGALARPGIFAQAVEDHLAEQKLSRPIAGDDLPPRGNPAIRQGFGPEVPGFIHVDGGNIDALEQGDRSGSGRRHHGADPGRRAV